MGTVDKPPTGEELAYGLAATALDAFYAPDELNHDLARQRYADLMGEACERRTLGVMHALVGLLNQAALMLACERARDLEPRSAGQPRFERGARHKEALRWIWEAYIARGE
jgi:hypothetical protein